MRRPLILAALAAATLAHGVAWAEEAKIRPPGPPPAAPAATWLGRVLAVPHIAATVARRNAARTALAAVGTQARPDPKPYRAAAELAQACLDALPPPSLVDVTYVSRARGMSLEQLGRECEMLRAQAQSEAERSAAELAQRAQVIRPLLAADRLRVFDAEGEPDCAKCEGDAKKIAAAREWLYVRGPSGPLATYETLVFVFRGDRLIERRQRVAHESP